ncbi:hypothetical protein KR038_011608, partial [Drosophila bunnanda]
YSIITHFSCAVALLFCLASTGTAGPIDQDRQRLQDLQSLSQRTSDPTARVPITYEIVEIYKKYRGQEQSDSTEETELNADVNNFESKIVLVEGVPMQGGAFTDFFKGNLIPKNVKADATNLAKSSSQALIDGIAKYLLNKLWS